MITEKYLFLLGFFCTALFWGSCDSEQIQKINIQPKDLHGFSEDMTLDHLIYHQNFENINDSSLIQQYLVADSLNGTFYELSNEKQFSEGFKAYVLRPDKIRDILIKFKIRKTAESIRSYYDTKGKLVIQLDREDSTILFKEFDLATIVKQENKNIVDQFQELKLSYSFEDLIQKHDLLKIFLWNPDGGAIQFDDFTIEHWKKKRNIQYACTDPYYLSPPNKADSSSTITELIQRPGQEFFSIIQATADTFLQQETNYLEVEFSTMIQEPFEYFKESSRLAISIKRNNINYHWEEHCIDCRIWDGEQFRLGQWQKMRLNFKIPTGVLPADVINVFFWNDRFHSVLVKGVKYYKCSKI